MANRRRQWLLDQVFAGHIRAATLPELRQADDDFCDGAEVGAYCRCIVRMAKAETETSGGSLTAPATYLARVLELEIEFHRSPVAGSPPAPAAAERRKTR